MKLFELRRETIHYDIRIFTGTELECVERANKLLENKQVLQIATDIHMRPVFNTKSAAFYLKEVK